MLAGRASAPAAGVWPLLAHTHLLAAPLRVPPRTAHLLTSSHPHARTGVQPSRSLARRSAGPPALSPSGQAGWHPGPPRRHTRDPGPGALTDEGHGLGVDDAAGQQVEVVLPAVHHYGVASVVAPLGTETWLSVQAPAGVDLPWAGLPSLTLDQLQSRREPRLGGLGQWVCPPGPQDAVHAVVGSDGCLGTPG